MIEMFVLGFFLFDLFFWSLVISVGSWKKAICGQAALEALNGLWCTDCCL